MPAESQAQVIAAQIALHAPDRLYDRNKSLLELSQGQLRAFAQTKRKGLPKKKRKRR